jgi:hypothetical protein
MKVFESFAWIAEEEISEASWVMLVNTRKHNIGQGYVKFGIV